MRDAHVLRLRNIEAAIHNLARTKGEGRRTRDEERCNAVSRARHQNQTKPDQTLPKPNHPSRGGRITRIGIGIGIGRLGVRGQCHKKKQLLVASRHPRIFVFVFCVFCTFLLSRTCLGASSNPSPHPLARQRISFAGQSSRSTHSRALIGGGGSGWEGSLCEIPT